MGNSLIKITVWTLILASTFGFRLRNTTQHWDISTTDPYLWVRPCDRTIVFGTNDVPSDDALFGDTSVSMEEAIESIIADVNSIYGSYLRLELYPADPSSLPAGSQFDATKALTRTIEVCTGPQQGLGGGNSEFKIKDKQIIGCKALYVDTAEASLIDFLWIVQHEMGHCLHLEHPQDITKAVMSYYRDQKSVYRYTSDDKNGIRYRFPAIGFDLEETPTLGLSCQPKE